MSDWSEASEPGKKCCSSQIHTDSLVEATESTYLLRSNSVRSDVLINNFDKIWMTCLAFIVITGTAIGLYLLWTESGDNVSDDVDLIPRNIWGATPVTRNITVLKLPVDYVLIFQTNTTECENNDCVFLMKKIQNEHINILNEPDILYNFVVASDRRLYEGRGWENASLEDKNTFLAIALIGDFNKHRPSEKQTNTLLAFLDYAVREQKIVPCFHVLVDHLSRRYLVDLASVIETHIINKNNCD